MKESHLSGPLRISGLRSKNSFVVGFVTVHSGSGSLITFSALSARSPDTLSTSDMARRIDRHNGRLAVNSMALKCRDPKADLPRSTKSET